MLQEIPLVWKASSGGSYRGMLGAHQVAYLCQHDGETQWRWAAFGCNGSNQYCFQTADSLEAAKEASLGCIQQWFRDAGLLQH